MVSGDWSDFGQFNSVEHWRNRTRELIAEADSLEAERDRLREALEFIEANAPPECATAARIAREALAGPKEGE